MKKRALAIVVAGAGALALSAWYWATKVHVVDPAPAVAFANDYFALLHEGRVPDALAMYGGAFPKNPGDNWHQLLSGMQSKMGTVKVATLEKSIAVPKGGTACFLLRYLVERQAGRSVESLVVCPGQDRGLSIVGHEMINPTTGQRIAAGLTIETSTVKF